MADKPPPPPRVPNLSRETPTTAAGHRNLVILWIIGLVLMSLAIWGVAKMSAYLQPPRGHGINNSP